MRKILFGGLLGSWPAPFDSFSEAHLIASTTLASC